MRRQEGQRCARRRSTRSDGDALLGRRASQAPDLWGVDDQRDPLLLVERSLATSIVNLITASCAALEPLSLVFLALHPCPDVWRTVAKRYPVACAGPQESDDDSVHKHDVLEV